MAKDAYAQGKLAYEHNHPMSSCEYPVGSSLRAEWMAGWTQASNTDPKRGQVPAARREGTRPAA
ncbi:Rmf/CrpP family protein [Aureimonas populi]|uniref:Rmf/CrpP family protein n=1 Tax=Aureimonas populi TaxID=1701758 RepID=A0ABW5CHJ0_9HYPH|nr:Rmf/CrpP family protein [Aureimonas populi]